MKHLDLALFCTTILMTACQPVSIVEDENGSNATVLLHVRTRAYDFLPFETRVAKDISDVSKRLSYTLFDMSGNKVMNTKSQTVSDESYGNFNVSLSPDSYILVTVAHNGEGNCTITSPTEVSFYNNKTTDTFSSCDTISVKDGEKTIDISLVRRVAMVRIVLDEVLPEDVAQIKFTYTGGSSTLDPNTGYGCKNSRQTEIRDVPASAYESSGSTYEIYTMPHESQDVLKITINTLNSAGDVLTELVMSNVPVRIGEITQYHGSLCNGDNSQGITVGLSVDYQDWVVKDYTF